MTIEEQVRDALRSEAERYTASPDLLDRVRDEAHDRMRGRRRRLAAAGALTAAAVAAGALVAVATLPDDDGGDVRVGPAATTPTSAPTTVVPDAMSEPGTAVVVDARRRRLLLVSTVDGRTIQMLHEVDGRNSSLRDVEVSQDRTWTFFEVTTRTGTIELWKVADNGLPAEYERPACLPTLSPDDRRLAVFLECGPNVLVRNLDTGDEQLVAAGAWEEDRSPTSLAWSPDGGALFFGAALPESPTELWRLNLATATALTDATRVDRPATLPEGTDWNAVGALPATGDVLVHESCCSLDAGSDDLGGRLLALDPRTGAIRRAMEPPVGPVDADADSEGRYLLLLDTRNQLWSWDIDGEHRRVLGGVVFATW